jgi:hypothetical protein
MVSIVFAVFPATAQGTDNACYPGGELEGKCINDTWWEAGWWSAQLDAGNVSINDVPAQYIALLVSAGVLDADTDLEDNLCNRPGRNCTTEWEWVAGWYVVRVEDGRLSRDQVPAAYQTALPELTPVEEAVPAGPSCITTASGVLSIFCHVGGNAFSTDTFADGSINFYNLIVPSGATCPATYNGYAVAGFPPVEVAITGFDRSAFVVSKGFSSTDLSCSYPVP